MLCLPTSLIIPLCNIARREQVEVAVIYIDDRPTNENCSRFGREKLENMLETATRSSGGRLQCFTAIAFVVHVTQRSIGDSQQDDSRVDGEQRYLSIVMFSEERRRTNKVARFSTSPRTKISAAVASCTETYYPPKTVT